MNISQARSSSNAIGHRADVFCKWAPVVIATMARFTGLPAKNKFVTAVKISLVAKLIVNSVVEPLKKITKRRRPDSFVKFNSFPSGHTATSFMGAAIMQEELKAFSPALSTAGYGFAVSTAMLRVMKRKHWVSDVVAGALIGIAAAKLSYALFARLSITQ